jgi:hypothetical protein
MAAWPVHDIAPGCVFRVTRDMPPLPPALDAEVSRLWAAAQARLDGKLFNGRVFSADVITRTLVCGHWTEFRRVVAQVERNALHKLLGIRPLAVGGVVAGPDGVVFGRRPARAIYLAGEWQLPPAGSVDPGAARADGTVDVVAQLLIELREELGMAADAVRAPRLLGIVEHGGSHVLDLGIAVDTALSAAEIRALHAARGNGEYGALEIVPLPALPAFLAAAGPMLNHQAPVFLRRALGAAHP